VSIGQIESPRDTLLGIADAAQVTVLLVQAPLGSWDGLGDFDALVSIEVGDPAFVPPREGLEPIAACAGLTALTVEIDDGTVGLDALAALRSLDYLRIIHHGRSGASLEGGWLGKLAALEELFVLVPGGWLVEASLGALSGLPRLRTLDVHCVHPREGAELFASGFPALEHLEYSTTDMSEEARVWAARPELMGGLHEHRQTSATSPEIVADGDGRFLVFVALPSMLDLEDSEEAVDRVSSLLLEEHPPWAGDIVFAPETESASVTAARREDLEALLAWLKDQFGEVH
jgi:hypothetical protein